MKVIRENNLRFDETMSFGDDRLFNFDYLSCFGQFQIIPDVLYNYYTVDDSLSRRSFKRSCWDAYNRLFDRCKGISSQWDDRQRTSYYEHFFVWFVRCCQNTMMDPSLSFWEKIRKNNMFLQTEFFSVCFPYAEKTGFHPVYLKAMATRNYLWVWAVGRMSDFKHKLIRR